MSFPRYHNQRSAKSAKEFTTIDVVAAAFMAYATNGQKIEKRDIAAQPATSVSLETSMVVSNRTLVNRLLQNPANITAEARQEAVEAIAYLQNAILMGVLTGRIVPKFTLELVGAIENETMTENRIGIAVYTPSTYYNGKAKDVIKELTNERMYTSQALGRIGEKVAFNFTCLEKKYIQVLDCFSAYGTDDAGNLVKFFDKA